MKNTPTLSFLFLFIVLLLPICLFSQQFSFGDTIYSQSKINQVNRFFQNRKQYLEGSLQEVKNRELRTYKRIIKNREELYRDLIDKKILYFDEETDTLIQKILNGRSFSIQASSASHPFKV